ncbi:MAG: hypothetical protein FJ144_21950 [Deltaproteobacteria bacterium]|nr:hypothetical protein [Deltaproteobacteria bacterium]
MNAVFERYDEEYCTDCGFPADFYEFYGPRIEAGAAAGHVNHPADLYKVDWLQIDDTITTSVEVWNTGGAGDNEPGFGNALWALRAGFRLGLVGVSDDHSADTDPILLGTGLTGCEAEALTRADLLQVLRARGCYATSGERIELRFSVDGAPMGSELERPVGSVLPVVIEVKATETPVTVELLRDGDVIAREKCATPMCGLSTRVRVEEPNQFYYARIHQPGDERAWSSPVWIEGACTRPFGCLRSRLLRGGGAPEDDCLTEWLRAGRPLFEPRSSPGADLLCVDGDPRCDFGDTPDECTMRIGLCVGVEDAALAECEPAVPESIEILSPSGSTDRESPDFQNEQTLAALLHAIRPNENGPACSPLSELRVPLGRLRVVTSASAGSRVDDDTLVVECQPATAHRHPHRHRPAHHHD